jgi:hypothetical protein
MPVGQAGEAGLAASCASAAWDGRRDFVIKVVRRREIDVVRVPYDRVYAVAVNALRYYSRAALIF